MPYVEFDVPAGTAPGIARFYREIMGATATVGRGTARARRRMSWSGRTRR